MPDDLPDSIVKIFRKLVSERLLPLEIISKIIILTQGVMWKHRMLRSSVKKSSDSAAEAGIATHLLAMHRALLEVGAEELVEAPPDDSEDPAQSITATFRRTIPALRMASKWIRANFKYFASDGVQAASIDGVSEFWEVFARFSTALERTFPLKSLPPLTTPLEEDWDTRGFLPLTKLMATGTTPNHITVEDGRKVIQREQVHPNVEQLMRLWDLLTDARVIAESQVLIDTKFRNHCV
jgi:Est1 DNA/RNA binding domain